MFRRAGKWLVVATVGVLAVGLVGLGVVYAQGPNPARAPQANCPVAPQGAGLGMGWHWGGSMLQTWADALGMKVEDVTAAVRDGKTIADLAEQQGITIEDLVANALTTRKEAVQQAVEDERLTQEQADTILEQMQERMTENLQNGTCAPGTGYGPGAGQGCGRFGANAQSQTGRPGGFGRGMCTAVQQDN